MASQMGYSLIQTSPNFIGHLTLSQIHALFNGQGSINRREADANKQASNSSSRMRSGRHEAGNIEDLKRFPGVRMQRRQRKK